LAPNGFGFGVESAVAVGVGTGFLFSTTAKLLIMLYNLIPGVAGFTGSVAGVAGVGFKAGCTCGAVSSLR
jgi:hypothetical protein